jgi:hypothetical protein
VSDTKAEFLDWVSPVEFGDYCALTLTLRPYVKVRSEVWFLDRYAASRNFRFFMNRLNRRFFGNASKRGAGLNVIPIIEGGKDVPRGKDVRLHYHVLLEKPPRLSEREFARVILVEWMKTPFGLWESKLEYDADYGWLKYMTKETLSEKSVALDNVDLANLRVGT